MDSNKYRMADTFQLPTFVRPFEDDESFWDVADQSGISISDNQVLSDYASVAIDSHDAMQDRIAELEQERDQLQEIINAAHDYLRHSLKLGTDEPRRFDFYAQQVTDIQAKAIKGFARNLNEFAENKGSTTLEYVDFLGMAAVDIKHLRQQSTISE